MANGIPLQVRVPREATTSSGDLAQWPSTQLIGMIRASTDQLEQRLQQANGMHSFIRRKHSFQACQTQEEYAKIQVD
jgi:hypothetical protein